MGCCFNVAATAFKTNGVSVSLTPLLFIFRREFLAQFAHPREINVVELRDTHDAAPAFAHAPRNDFARGRDRLS